MAAARASRKAKKDVYEIYAKALEAVQKGNYKTALTAIGQIEKGFPSEIEVLARARSLQAVCDRRLEGDSSKGTPTAEDLYDRGVFHHNQGEFEVAMDFFSKALKKDSDAPWIHYALAATEARQGNSEEALGHLETAIAGDEANRFRAENDPDMESLLEEDGFHELIAD